MEFSSRYYQLAHGKAPRGYGSWAFYFDASAATAPSDQAWWAPAGMFGEAKRAAVAEAKRRGASRIEVAS